MHMPVPEGIGPGIAARQMPAILAQHGDDLDLDLLARQRMARDGDARRRRPVITMRGIGDHDPWNG